MRQFVREYVPFTENLIQTIIETSLPILRFTNKTNGYEVIRPFDFLAKIYQQSSDYNKWSSFSIKDTSSSNAEAVVVTGVVWLDEEKMEWECMYVSFQADEKEIMFAKKFLEAIFSFKVLSSVTLVDYGFDGMFFKQGLTAEEDEMLEKRINGMMLTNNINIQFFPFMLTKHDIKRLISDNF